LEQVALELLTLGFLLPQLFAEPLHLFSLPCIVVICGLIKHGTWGDEGVGTFELINLVSHYGPFFDPEFDLFLAFVELLVESCHQLTVLGFETV